jgi:hypothetical protein
MLLENGAKQELDEKRMQRNQINIPIVRHKHQLIIYIRITKHLMEQMADDVSKGMRDSLESFVHYLGLLIKCFP